MKNADYTAALAIFNELAAKAEAINEEYKARLIEAYGEEARWYFSDLAAIGRIQCYPTQQTEGAEYSFSTESADFYEYTVNGKTICECIRKGVTGC